MTWNRQRTYATLVGFGICVLLIRTAIMLTGGSLTTFMPWASGLLVLEFLLNVSVVLAAIWWWIGATEARAWLALRLTVAAVVVHAVRVAVYIIGRTGPWHDFDVRPAFHGAQPPEWHWVIFAGTMAFLSLIVTAVIWRIRRRAGRCEKGA